MADVIKELKIMHYLNLQEVRDIQIDPIVIVIQDVPVCKNYKGGTIELALQN